MRKATLPIALSAALILACAACIALYSLYKREATLNDELTEKLEKLAREEKRSAVMQSINAQMEEIATQERKVSDMQREEAIEQRKLAEEQRQNALEQRRQAEEQRQNALTAEQKAVEASEVAQWQRTIAEQQRAEAEHSKRVADTLSYIAMARNLGIQAVTQRNAGNEQLAELLAYAAYQYTNRYNGDVNNPSVYQALSLTSASIRKWNVGRGAIMKMWKLPGGSTFATVSTYGEIAVHTKGNDGGLRSDMIFQNSNYDFRDMVIDDNGTIYALSHTGHLIYGTRGNLSTIAIEGAVKPFRLFCHTDGEMLVVAQQSIHLLETKTMRQIRKLTLDFKTNVAGEDDRQIVVFDTKGNAFTVDNKATEVKPKKLPFKVQPIISYAYKWTNGYEAYGTQEGSIFIVDDKGVVQRLVGHSSRVSRVKFDGNRLYSTSYDGTVRFWPFTQQKIEPMTIIDTRQWVISFVFDDTMSYIWTGDMKGSLTESLIDPHLMAERVHGKLKREFTREEWNYYIGQNIPYEKMK